MPSPKDALDEYVKGYLGAEPSGHTAIRKLFLYDLPITSRAPHDHNYEIADAVATHFNVALGCIKLAGSAQTGYSYYSARDFTPGESDYDLAIISPGLFRRFSETAFSETDGYSNDTKFPSPDGARQFKKGILKGMLRPDLMPRCADRSAWLNFFGRLSGIYPQYKSINAAIYFSELYFETKQRDLIARIKGFRL